MPRHMTFWNLLPVLLLGLGTGTAQAAALSTYYFSGNCDDCIGIGKAELTVSDYMAGTAITNSNFVSFHYDGTNLQPTFTIDSSNLAGVSGTMNSPFPSTENFTVASRIVAFSSGTIGGWSVYNPSAVLVADFGHSSQWTDVPLAAAVPEPMSMTLLAGSLCALVTFRARRS